MTEDDVVEPSGRQAPEDGTPGPAAALPEDGGAEPATPCRRSRLRRALVAAGLLIVVSALVVGARVWYLVETYDDNIERLGDVFAQVDPEQRPTPPPSGDGEDAPLTFLLSSDTSSDGSEPPSADVDLIMLLRFTGDRANAQVVSFPRDVRVPIPGRGTHELGTAWSTGGPPLLISTIEQLTRVRVDHFARIDFDGLLRLTDSLGGVDVVLDEPLTSGPYTFPAGRNRLTGDQARWFVQHPWGRTGREERQQQYLLAVFVRVSDQNLFSALGGVDSTLAGLTEVISVDDSLGMGTIVSLGVSLSRLDQDAIDHVTVPVVETAAGVQRVLRLDQERARAMWGYLATDTLREHAAEFDRPRRQRAIPD